MILRSLIIVFFLQSAFLFSQNDTGVTKPLFSYSVSAHQAFVLVHSREIREIEDAYPRGLQVDLSWQQRDESSFNRCNCFPKLGASFQFWDFDNPEILGYGINAYFFVEPEYGASKFFSFSFRGGFGASILSNPHHPIENPDNQSYSTNIAFALIVAAKGSFRISNRDKIDFSAYYNHISNGGIKQPNKGINYPSLSLGITHNVNDLEYENHHKTDWKKSERQKRLDLTSFVSWKQVDKDVHVFAPGFEVKYSYQVASLSAITAGMEYLDDNFAKYQYEKNGVDDEWRKSSMALGHEFLLGRILFSQQLGIYLYNPDWQGDPVYQRYGFVYRFTDVVGLGINVKAHRQVADLVDYRLSISF